MANPTIDEVEPSEPVSDLLNFGDADKGGNVHQECNPCNVEPFKQMNVFLRITSPNVPLDKLTAPLSTNLSQSPGLCALSPPNRPLTCNVAIEEILEPH